MSYELRVKSKKSGFRAIDGFPVYLSLVFLNFQLSTFNFQLYL